MEHSTRIYNIYLKYIAPEDIHVYSIDEVFIDLTHYLSSSGLNAREFAKRDVYKRQDGYILPAVPSELSKESGNLQHSVG